MPPFPGPFAASGRRACGRDISFTRDPRVRAGSLRARAPHTVAARRVSLCSRSRPCFLPRSWPHRSRAWCATSLQVRRSPGGQPRHTRVRIPNLHSRSFHRLLLPRQDRGRRPHRLARRSAFRRPVSRRQGTLAPKDLIARRPNPYSTCCQACGVNAKPSPRRAM
jgi:hypothetical protein